MGKSCEQPIIVRLDLEVKALVNRLPPPRVITVEVPVVSTEIVEHQVEIPVFIMADDGGTVRTTSEQPALLTELTPRMRDEIIAMLEVHDVTRSDP